MVMKIVRQPLVREALEWTGENLASVQQFMYPHSPYYHQEPAETFRSGAYVPLLQIPVRNAEHELRFPNLGPQFKQEIVRPGDWIYKDGESFAVVRKGEFDAEWVRKREREKDDSPRSGVGLDVIK